MRFVGFCHFEEDVRTGRQTAQWGEITGVEKSAQVDNLSRMSIERSLLASQGYIELEMPVEALAELDALGAEHQDCEEVLQLRLFVVMRGRLWEPALAVCARLRSIYPDCSTGFIHGAFCLHEMGRTAEAKEVLLAGPSSLSQEATYHYNLGCYDAVLGNRDEAQAHLRTSFELDKKFREIAKYDPDLKSVSDLF